MTVRVGKLPGVLTEVALETGATVKDAVEFAGVDPTGFQVNVNGEAATDDTTVADGSTILLVKKIKGAATL